MASPLQERLFFIFGILWASVALGSGTDDLLMRAALELAQGDAQAEFRLKQVIAQADSSGRSDLVAQAAQLLAVAPLSDAALAQGQGRKRHVFAEMALSRGRGMFSQADRLQLERVAADGFFDAKDLVRAKSHYLAIVQDSTSSSGRDSSNDRDLGAVHYAEYRLAWVDWNQKHPQDAWDRLAALLSGARGLVKSDLRLLVAKDLGRLLLECDPAGANERAKVFAFLLSTSPQSALERLEAARGLAQALKRLITESEFDVAWQWFMALANQNGGEILSAAMIKSLESAEPWTRFSCQVLDRLNASSAVLSATQSADWSRVVLACLKKDTSSARLTAVLALARQGMSGVLGQPEVSGVLVTRLLRSTRESELTELQSVLKSCAQKCWKNWEAEAALWRAWAVALPQPAAEPVRADVDRYLEGARGGPLHAQDWALELALSPPQALSPRLMERLVASAGAESQEEPRELVQETVQRYLAMRSRGEWVIEESGEGSGARPLPKWLGCGLRLEQYLTAERGNVSGDECVRGHRDWAWLNAQLDAPTLGILTEGFQFNARLPARVERDLKRMRKVLRGFELRVWSDGRFLNRSREELRARVILPWLARLEQVALPTQSGPEVAALKEKLLVSVRGIVSELGGTQ